MYTVTNKTRERRKKRLENELAAEELRTLVRGRSATQLRNAGLGQFIQFHLRNPEGTPRFVTRGVYHRPGSRRHGTQHMARLNAVERRLNHKRMVRKTRAQHRIARENEFNAESAVEATPFNVPVNVQATWGHRPKKEQMNQLPLARRVQSLNVLVEKERLPESNLHTPWRLHRPGMAAARSRSRSRTRREKGRARSPSQPRRPRSHSP